MLRHRGNLLFMSCVKSVRFAVLIHFVSKKIHLVTLTMKGVHLIITLRCCINVYTLPSYKHNGMSNHTQT